ncbi:hypothetical protein [Flavobacterium sp.]|uniref:hypothetical protein n=1 Tax=Flavobacterium sp. TaxID=239 RepID=UPI002620121E|nr:hypothetical protein [Flavobacterium sp.]MDD3005187.1 hypothetical protein [Flavobacterium sp.]
MRILLIVLSLFIGLQTFAQKKDCQYASEINDSIGSYKETKSFLMHEKVFAGKSSYLFFSLANEQGVPFLKVQKIEKSPDFIKVNCFDKNSRIFIQLLNGKIITLIYSDQDTCGNLIRLENDPINSRVLSGNFVFLKGSFEELKSSPIWEIRIRFATETIDFAIKKEFYSELMQETYLPESYFMNNLDCIIN